MRRRIYAPSPGLHPGLAPLDPLVIEWSTGGRSQRIELHSWKPGGGPYEGLPVDAAEAQRRRNERIKITNVEGGIVAFGYWPETRPYTIDLRGS